MSLLTRAAATLAATAVVLAPSTVGAAHADDAPLPTADTFYGYGAGGISTPGTPPAASKPGDVLKSRSVRTTLTDLQALLTSSGTTFSATATQVLYRTQNEMGAPAQTVTTVFRPAGVSRGVVAYLSFYDGLGDKCDPSFTLQGSSAGMEAGIIGQLVESGYTVTVPDFEGETLDWAAGHEAGWSTLDAIRATETKLGLPAATTPVGMMGYSGGSFAGDWASELASTYPSAKDLDLVGTAIGGVPAKLDDVMNYVDGVPNADGAVDGDRDSWAGVIPAALVSLGRANGEDFSQYESTVPTYTAPDGTQLSGQDITEKVSDQCIAEFAGTYQGLHVSDLLAPGQDSLLDLPGVDGGPSIQDIIARNKMGTGGTPTMPMLFVQGRSQDNVGDGVMVSDNVKTLADEYRTAGVPVTYTEVSGVNAKGADLGLHSPVGQTFVLSALGFLDRLMPVPPAHTPAPSAPPAVHAIKATLKGHSKGHQDVLVVTAKGAPGAHVKLFRAGHKKAIGHGTIHKSGKVTIKVKDRNGNAKTRYHAVVAATSATKAAKTKVLRLH